MIAKNRSWQSIEGVIIGKAVSANGLTGTSVLVFPDGAVASAEVRGFATGTRQMDSLSLTHTVEKAYALVVSGGSVFGLDAASAVARELNLKNIGLFTGITSIPVVPTAVIYDLSFPENVGTDYGELGKKAIDDAFSTAVGEEGGGAGAGASVGKILGIERATKTSKGLAARWVKDGYHVGAMVVLNAFGDVYDKKGGIVAGVRRMDGKGYDNSRKLFMEGHTRKPFGVMDSTTVTAVVTDADLGKKELFIVASQINNFLASHIRPYGSIFDGDIVFSLSTGKKGKVDNLLKFIVMAEEVVYESLMVAVFSAESSGGLPCAREIMGEGGEIGRD
ncbi:MAG: P1 family peptidase [Deltaproteobacteria bacterium]|nr:P1 family peptidase [Deltaproteobacteria bacterium]